MSNSHNLKPGHTSYICVCVEDFSTIQNPYIISMDWREIYVLYILNETNCELFAVFVYDAYRPGTTVNCENQIPLYSA